MLSYHITRPRIKIPLLCIFWAPQHGLLSTSQFPLYAEHAVSFLSGGFVGSIVPSLSARVEGCVGLGKCFALSEHVKTYRRVESRLYLTCHIKSQDLTGPSLSQVLQVMAEPH